MRDKNVCFLDGCERHIGGMRTIELPLELSVSYCRSRRIGGFVPRVDKGRIEKVIGIYQMHEAGVYFRRLVLVEGGRKIRGFRKGERFMAEDSEGSWSVSRLMVWVLWGVRSYLSVT